ncbi:MAG: uncharacterized protein A8A55_1303 [Amphiamblys sp. WSBS2006]|nr:MAG: uncharacterized protein A8A55_1303 [Amphiamblys sp. WSBS2006]
MKTQTRQNTKINARRPAGTKKTPVVKENTERSFNTAIDEYETKTNTEKKYVGRDSIMFKQPRKRARKKAQPPKPVSSASSEPEPAPVSEHEEEQPMRADTVAADKQTTVGGTAKHGERGDTRAVQMEELIRRLRDEREALVAENRRLVSKNRELAEEGKRLLSEKETVLLEKVEASMEKEKRRESIFSNTGDEREIGEKDATLELYYALTGLNIVPAADDAWECSFETPSGEFGFRMKLDARTEKVHYSPHMNSAESKELRENLPGYLCEELIFGTEQLMKFFQRLFTGLFDKGKRK